MAENSKIEKLKCDILGDFQTLWVISITNHDNEIVRHIGMYRCQRCALAFALEDNLTAADIRLIQSDVFSKVPISKSICHQISVKLLKRHY